LTPDLAEHDHFNLHREGSVRIDMKFGTVLAYIINAIIYAEFENILEINLIATEIYYLTTMLEQD